LIDDAVVADNLDAKRAVERIAAVPLDVVPFVAAVDSLDLQAVSFD
jgi:hypothetical protein